jgi:hypothetical protein
MLLVFIGGLTDRRNMVLAVSTLWLFIRFRGVDTTTSTVWLGPLRLPFS